MAGVKLEKPVSTQFSDPRIWLIPAAALAVAILPMPYGYYQLLRVLVFVFAAFWFLGRFSGAGASHEIAAPLWMTIAMILTAALWNPVFPVHLGTRALWAPLNIAAAVLFTSAFFRESRIKAQHSRSINSNK